MTYPMMHVMCLVPPSVDRQTPVKIGAGGKKDGNTCTIHSDYLEGHLVSFHGVLNVFLCVWRPTIPQSPTTNIGKFQETST